MASSQEPRDERHLEDLIKKYKDEFSEEEIRKIYKKIASGFDKARIRSYVGELIFQKVKRKLKKRAREKNK